MRRISGETDEESENDVIAERNNHIGVLFFSFLKTLNSIVLLI